MTSTVDIASIAHNAARSGQRVGIALPRLDLAVDLFKAMAIEAERTGGWSVRRTNGAQRILHDASQGYVIYRTAGGEGPFRAHTLDLALVRCTSAQLDRVMESVMPALTVNGGTLDLEVISA